MANHEIPRRAKLAEHLFGVDDDGNVVRFTVYWHQRPGHPHPMFYVLQYREVDRKIDRDTRWTREFTGPRAQAKIDAVLDEVRPLLAESRELAASVTR
jgi:hypothetical protein